MSKQIISNLAHIPANALLTSLCVKAFERRKIGSDSTRVNTFIHLVLMLFAGSDEFRQSFVPGRTASFMNLGLDVLDILFGLGTFKILRLVNIIQEK